jgi:hypothetical protein
LWSELVTTRRALAEREAELAVGVPLVVRDDDEHAASLAERLEAVLRGGAEAIGCQAAALYLLDSATSELKLRASWGLPQRRFAEPARPLRPALADLEALLGHAVVLDDPALFEYWKVPEKGFLSCVCVPISSPSMPLGTLWAFCERKRGFNDAQTNILEVVAGRLAADLERETLVDEAVAARDQSQQIAAAERWQKEQLPTIAPVVEGWEIAARAAHGGQLGGTFYDWFAVGDDILSLLAGDMRPHGLEGAFAASALRGAARAFESKRHAPQQFLQKANSILWSGSAGGSSAGVFHAIVDGKSANVRFAAAGPMRVVAIDAGGVTAIGGPSTALGQQEEIKVASHSRRLAGGALVLAYGTSLASEDATFAELERQFAEALVPCLRQPAAELAEIADGLLARQSSPRADRVVVILQRRA